MGDFQNLKNQAAVIRDEQLDKKNTALRIGKMFIDMLEQLENVLPDENVQPDTLTVEPTETSYKLKFSTIASDGTIKSREVSLPLATETKAGIMSPALLKGVKDQLTELGEKIPNTNFITCSTLNGVANKTVNILDFKLSNRVRLLIKMVNANAADNANLSISSPQLDTKPLYYNGERASSTNSWKAGAVLDIYYDGANFQATDFAGGAGNSSGGNMILEWNTDVATTRKQVKQADRKEGMQISYKNDSGEWINEQYIGTSVTDTEWVKDANWESIASRSDIDDIQTALGLTYKSYSREYISGFISDKGVVTESSTYKHTEPILLKKGEFIQVSGYCDGAALLSKTDVLGSNYTPIYVAVGATIHTYRYQAKAEEYVCVSWKTEVDIVIGTSSLDEIKGGQEEHDKKIAQIESIIGPSDYITTTYEQGNISYTDGLLYTDNTRVRSSYIANVYSVINTNPDIKFGLRYYKNNKFIYGDSEFTEGVSEKKIDIDCDSIRAIVGMINNSAISPTSPILHNLSFLGYSDISNDIKNLKNSIDNIDPNPLKSEISIGTINGDTGADEQSNTRARCIERYDATTGLLISVPLGIKIAFRYYDYDGAFVRTDDAWTTHSGDIISKQWGGILRFVLSYNDDREINGTSDFDVTVQKKIPNAQYSEAFVNANNTSLVLKAILDRNWDDGTIVSQAYLWHDKDLKFYLSNSINGFKTLIFNWNLTSKPYEYSMAILQTGDILAVWRTEQKTTGSNDSIRRNPIIFQKSNGYEPLEVDFGDKLKPSAWLQNCGFTHVYKGDFFMFSEYARPSIERACVWKVTGDYTVSDNWKVVLEKELSGFIDSGFKHFHAVQYDPYSGIIYAASGDDDTAAAIYVSKDNGDSFELLHGPNEKDCRLLNFIFTKDKIYWASDSGYAGKHFLFSIERGEDNVMNFSTLTELHEFEQIGGSAGIATYASCYIPLLNCILFLDRADIITASMPLYVYDIGTNKVVKVDDISFFSNRYGGFRTECSQLYTTSRSIIVGFGYTQFPSSDNRNNMKLLGNTEDECNIRNIVLRLEKSGDGYRVTYDTVMS